MRETIAVQSPASHTHGPATCTALLSRGLLVPSQQVAPRSLLRVDPDGTPVWIEQHYTRTRAGDFVSYLLGGASC